MICFCHMIKTAGTTLHYIFRSNYGSNYVQIDRERFTPENLKFLLRFNKGIKAIGGHPLRSCTQLHLAAPNIKYITFLRDPVDRFVSHFNHAKVKNALPLSMGEHIRRTGEANYQTKFLIGAMDLRERSYHAGDKELALAKHILSNDFAFVGIVEKFYESMILMRRMLNLESFDIRFQEKNVAQKKMLAKETMPLNLMESIRNVNLVDHELYRYAKDVLFEKQKLRYGADLSEAVENIKSSNINYKFNRININMFRLAKFVLYRPLLSLT